MTLPPFIQSDYSGAHLNHGVLDTNNNHCISLSTNQQLATGRYSRPTSTIQALVQYWFGERGFVGTITVRELWMQEL